MKKTMTTEDKKKGGRPTKNYPRREATPSYSKMNTMEYFTLKNKASEADINKNKFLRMPISERQGKSQGPRIIMYSLTRVLGQIAVAG